MIPSPPGVLGGSADVSLRVSMGLMSNPKRYNPTPMYGADFDGYVVRAPSRLRPRASGTGLGARGRTPSRRTGRRSRDAILSPPGVLDGSEDVSCYVSMDLMSKAARYNPTLM